MQSFFEWSKKITHKLIYGLTLATDRLLYDLAPIILAIKVR
jgi:hypothetical protein